MPFAVHCPLDPIRRRRKDDDMSTLVRKMAAMHWTGPAVIAILSALLALAFILLSQTPTVVK